MTIAELKIINWAINLCEYRVPQSLTESEILRYWPRQVKERLVLCREQSAAKARLGLRLCLSGTAELAKAETKGHCLRKALGGPRKIKPFVGTAKIYATTGQINL